MSWLQAKYVRKKKQKYSQTVTLERPTARLLAEWYHTTSALKVCMLRPDSLAAILLAAGLRPGSRVIVAEACQGLVVGAVMERLGGALWDGHVL